MNPTDELKPASDLPETMSELSEDGVSAKDMIAEDIDEHIEELQLEKAQEFYNINFYIADLSTISSPLKNKEGFEVFFDTKAAAESARQSISDKDNYSVVERRSLKTQNTL